MRGILRRTREAVVSIRDGNACEIGLKKGVDLLIGQMNVGVA